MKRCDLHIHSNYSYDTKQTETIESYCLKAIEKNVDVICFCDHIEYNVQCNTFDSFQFEKRIEEYKKVTKKYIDKVKVLLGFEIGSPHLHPEIVDKLKKYNPDMIIGSIHYPEVIDYFENDFDLNIWMRKFDQMTYDMVCYGNFNVVGHLDMLKKYYGDLYIADIDMQKRIIDKIIEKNLVLEINTSSLRSGISDTMPGKEIIEYYKDKGGKYVVINSDAHQAKDLFMDYDRVLYQLPKELKFCYFEKGKLIEA